MYRRGALLWHSGCTSLPFISSRRMARLYGRIMVL